MQVTVSLGSFAALGSRHPGESRDLLQHILHSMHEGLTSSFNTSMAAIGGFESAPTLAVAVSGGGDSMALLLLAHGWASERGGRAIALTVDHGLRPESLAEARQVAAWCAKHGIEHHTLRIQDSEFTIQGRIQEAARDARYALLANWCKAHHILHLLTGHHLGDQTETLFFRLARGSGLDGLASMPALSYAHGVRIIRPLLPVRKSELEAFLQDKNQPWIHDASNNNATYTRNIVRNNIEKSGQPEVLSQRAGALAERFGNIRNILENKLASYLTNAVSLFPEGYGILYPDAFSRLAPDYGLRTLSALLTTLGGEDHPPRTGTLKKLYHEIISGAIRTRRTLGGCQFFFRPKEKHFLVTREPAWTHVPISLKRNERTFWDGRFILSWHGGVQAPDLLTAGALGMDGARQLRDICKSPLPAPSLLATFPAFSHLEQIVCVPHIAYTHPEFYGLECMARFRPVKALAAQAFFSMNNLDHARTSATMMKGYA